jgi:transcriptional regulator with XRE-family HTH domain
VPVLGGVMNFGERLFYSRSKMGMTKKDIGVSAGIEPALIGKYERGDKIPNIKNFRKICVALKVSADYLLDIDLKKLWGMGNNAEGC